MEFEFDMNFVEDASGWVGCVLNVLYYLMLCPPFIQLLKGKINFEQTPGFFITICYINSFLWYIYGEQTCSDQIQYSNLISSIFCACLIAIYLIYEVKKYLTDSVINALTLITSSLAVYRLLVKAIDNYKVVGRICCITSIFMYLYPLLLLIDVLIVKNYLYIHIYSAYVYFLACLFWLIYGYIIEDQYVFFPHIIGIVLSFCQIFVYITYRVKYSIGHKTFNSPTIGIETTDNEIGKKETSIQISEENLIKIKEKPVIIVSKIIKKNY